MTSHTDGIVVITKELGSGIIISAQSRDGRYQWFCGNDGYLRDTVDGRTIYQMHYLNRDDLGSQPLPKTVAADVRAFWAALSPLVSARRNAAEQTRTDREAAKIQSIEELHHTTKDYRGIDEN